MVREKSRLPFEVTADEGNLHNKESQREERKELRYL